MAAQQHAELHLGILVQNPAGEYLLRRAPEKFGRPQGSMRLSESVEDACQRIILEEAGVVANTFLYTGFTQLLLHEQDPSGPLNIVYLEFKGSYISGEASNGYVWTSPAVAEEQAGGLLKKHLRHYAMAQGVKRTV